tara:strand:+ start:12201 stop:14306 length:2106 start_codon:yes stop_codon:yes gene_type:complete
VAERVWSASSAGSASTNGNWSGGSAPTSSDTVVFNNTSVENCTWDVTAVSTITVASTYTGVITVNSDIALTGLSCSRVGAFTASADRVFTFSGTAPYNSNKTFFQIGIAKDTSIFANETARRLFYFTYTGSTTGIKYEAGEYPNIVINSGSHTPDYVAPSLGTNTATAVKFYTLHIKGGAFAPASATPSTNDRAKEWISQGTAQTQFQVDSGVNTFNGGYSAWTFQAFTGSFVLPTNGTSTYNGCRFTWQKWIIDSSVAGVGGKANIASGSSVFLNDLTVNVGAGVSGSNTLGGTFHITNKPTIRGTWGFYPIADGIYVYKGLHTLNIADGGTGLQSVAAGLIPFGSTASALNTSTELSFADNTLHADKGIKLTENADHPIAAAAGTGILWVKNTTPSTLIFTNDAGTDTTLGSGGGSGDITGVTITTDSGGGSKAEDTGGSADFSILGSNGVGVTNSGTTITAVAVPAEIDHDSLNNFVAAEHVDWAGASAGTIHASNHADTNTQLSNAEVRAAVEAATDSNVFTDDDHTKLNALDLLEFAEYRMVNHNPSTSSSNDFNSNTRWVADLADTSFWTAATTASDHTSIVLHTDGYLTLAANGIYDVWFSTDIFGHGTSAANIDSFIEISTNNSGDRRYATTRKVIRINGIEVKYNHQTTAKIRTGGSAVNIYFSAYLNGCGFYLAAYNDYRTSVKVIRLGDA